MERKAYPSDVSDDEWAFVAPYLTLMTEEAPQRQYPLREVFNGLRYIVHTGMQWRMMAQRSAAVARGLPADAALAEGGRVRGPGARPAHVAARDRRTCSAAARSDPRRTHVLQSTPESGARAGYDGHKRRKGSKVHIAVDTLGQLLAVMVTPANEQERAQVAELAAQVQEATGDSVEVAFVDQGYTGEQAAADAAAHGIRLEVVKLPTAKHGFVLLPRRWVVERSFAWMARFRRLARDYERLSETLVGLHFVAFAMLLAHRFVTFMVQSS